MCEEGESEKVEVAAGDRRRRRPRLRPSQLDDFSLPSAAAVKCRTFFSLALPTDRVPSWPPVASAATCLGATDISLRRPFFYCARNSE